MELLDLDVAGWVLKSNIFYFYVREPVGNLKNDKAVSFGILNKIWIFISALISAPLLIIFLSPALQGFYYTFNSILGLQTVFILGIGQLIQQFVSHEWSKINYEPSLGIKGAGHALARLSAIKYFTLRWYSWLAAIMFAGLFAGGYYFMKNSHSATVNLDEWILPWLTVCILRSVQLIISPGIIFLDGINEVANVNKFRTEQSIIERILSWIILITGGKLWLFPAGALINAAG